MGENLGVVVSSHNIEHCDDRKATLKAIMAVLKDGGRIYNSLSTETIVGFRSKVGCIKSYDDHNQQAILSDFGNVFNFICINGVSIIYSYKQYQPSIFWTTAFCPSNYPNTEALCK